jgi:hypothetical protein
MKTSNFKLTKVFLTMGLIVFSLNVSSQDIQLTRQEKKEAEKAREYMNFMALDTLLQNKSFVLEADWLENQYGTKVPVLSDLNFIMVDSVKAVLQTGSNSRLGTNGVGGVTAEGSISDLKITKDVKNMSYYLRFTITSTLGIYDISMNIFSGNSARATITGLTRGKLVYDGRIEALYNSSVYKGRNTI